MDRQQNRIKFHFRQWNQILFCGNKAHKIVREIEAANIETKMLGKRATSAGVLPKEQSPKIYIKSKGITSFQPQQKTFKAKKGKQLQNPIYTAIPTEFTICSED